MASSSASVGLTTGTAAAAASCEAWVTLDVGDAPDLTDGAVVVSRVEICDDAGITVLGGLGFDGG